MSTVPRDRFLPPSKSPYTITRLRSSSASSLSSSRRAKSMSWYLPPAISRISHGVSEGELGFCIVKSFELAACCCAAHSRCTQHHTVLQTHHLVQPSEFA